MKRVLHPDFPVVEGCFQLSQSWELTLDQKYNRRVEDDDLVIWRPGFTIWLSSWNFEGSTSPYDQFQDLMESTSEKAFDKKFGTEKLPLYFSYRLAEDMGDDRVPAFYGFVVKEGVTCRWDFTSILLTTLRLLNQFLNRHPHL